MAELPSGTVTFLLIDVEGSTPLWKDAPGSMQAALARHDALFDAAMDAAGAATALESRSAQGEERFLAVADDLDEYRTSCDSAISCFRPRWTRPTISA